MFSKKINTKFHHEAEGLQISTSTTDLNAERFMNYLFDLQDKYGKIVIDGIDTSNQTIYLTTLNAQEYNDVNEKINDIKDLIYKHITK